MTPVNLLAVGAFGRAVAATLAAVEPIAVHAMDPPGDGPLPADLTGAVAVVSGRPVPALVDRIDALSFGTGIPWLPMVIEGTALRAGPLVVPGESACHRCFRGRLRQHAAAPAVDDAVDEHYRTSAADEPAGHLPGTVAVAADLLWRMLADPATYAGQFRQRELVSGRLISGHAVGVHGCDRCGLHRDEVDRSSVELFDSMSEVLAWSR